MVLLNRLWSIMTYKHSWSYQTDHGLSWPTNIHDLPQLIPVYHDLPQMLVIVFNQSNLDLPHTAVVCKHHSLVPDSCCYLVWSSTKVNFLTLWKIHEFSCITFWAGCSRRILLKQTFLERKFPVHSNIAPPPPPPTRSNINVLHFKGVSLIPIVGYMSS